ENDKRLRIETRARSYPSPYGTDKGGRSRPSSGPAQSPQRLSALARHVPSPRLRGEGARLVPRIDKGEGDAQQSCPSPHPLSPLRFARRGEGAEQSGLATILEEFGRLSHRVAVTDDADAGHLHDCRLATDRTPPAQCQ